MRTGAEIKLALDAFVTRWSGYGGTERNREIAEGARPYAPFGR